MKKWQMFFKHWWFPTNVDHSVDSADFATAYTSTPLNDLKHKLAIVIEELQEKDLPKPKKVKNNEIICTAV